MAVIGGGDDGSHRNYRMSPSPLPASHLLEVTLISAQDLHPADCWMKAYAVAWVHTDRKLRTCVDPSGGIDPNWNDKFVFRVDDAFLGSDTSAVNIDVFSSRCVRRDLLVGTVRLVLSSVSPSPATQFVALQVRRPRSLRPQGILNVGVAIVDAYMHMCVPMDHGAAFALKDLVHSPMRSMPRESVSDDLASVKSYSYSYAGAGVDDGHNEKIKKNNTIMSRNGSTNMGVKNVIMSRNGSTNMAGKNVIMSRNGSTNMAGKNVIMSRNGSSKVRNNKLLKMEAEELELKLEQWRIELTPMHESNRLGSRMVKQRRKSSCFCGSMVEEED